MGSFRHFMILRPNYDKIEKNKGVKFMIINSHVHVNTKGIYFYYPEYNFQRFLEEMRENNIDIAFPALNPKVELFRCSNELMNSSGTQHFSKHRIQVVSKNNMLVLQCKTCGTVNYAAVADPLREHNKELISITAPYRANIKPLIYILLCKSTIQKEIDFWEKNYPNDFSGFKLHPWNDQVNVADFKLRSNKPFLIHTGIRKLESAKNAITFAKNNPSLKVVIAHAGALDSSVLQEASLLNNVYIDCCPSTFMYESKYSSLYSPQEILAPEDIYYKALDYVSSEKILFGTDSPWGNSKQELEIVRNLHVSKDVKEQILFKNALKFYGI